MRPRDLWVVHYMLRAADMFAVCLSKEEADDMVADLATRDGLCQFVSNVVVWSCAVRS